MIILVAIVLILSWIVDVNTLHSNQECQTEFPIMKSLSNMTTFWINLDSSLERKVHMENMLSKGGFTSAVRVSAYSPVQSSFRSLIKQLEKPCKRNSDKDLAVVMSHLKAIHTALYHDPNPTSQYALILEDDVRWLFSIDFDGLLKTIPNEPFGILQLATSNHEGVSFLWNKFLTDGTIWHKVHWKDSSKNGRTHLFWSTQGYIINKQHVKAFIDDVVETSEISKEPLGYKIINSFFPDKCERTRERPCILAFCLFSDTYIYSGGGPTFILSLPILISGKVGMNSTIHQLEVAAHTLGFTKAKMFANSVRNQLINAMQENASQDKARSEFKNSIPSFIYPKLGQCDS